MIQYYVYTVLAGGVLVYVGRGKGNRWKHATSGKSHNYLLNEYYFRHLLLGDPPLQVEIVTTSPFRIICVQEEQRLIKLHQPICNISGKQSSKYKGEVYLSNTLTSDILFEEDCYVETEALHVQVEPDTCTTYLKS